jgi:biopolymer transport protein ExbB
MAEQRPAASTTSTKATSVQAKRSSNAISWLAPIICVIAGYIIWRFVMGAASGFKQPGEGWFWPSHKGPKSGLNAIYEGGIIVPLLIGMFLMVITFSIERFLTIAAPWVTAVSPTLSARCSSPRQRNVDKALAECDKQRGSVANVMKAGLRRYKEMINEAGLDTEQKVLSIQKEVEEATALELPMLQKNLVFLSTITSVGTLRGPARYGNGYDQIVLRPRRRRWWW